MEHSEQGHHADVRTAMDLLFALLEQLDSGDNEIVFLADEGGSWQVGMDPEKVLPTYFTSLAAVVEPEVYAARVMEIIDAHGAYNAAKWLKAARKVANPPAIRLKKEVIMHHPWADVAEWVASCAPSNGCAREIEQRELHAADFKIL
jgi:hypothetical protein